MSRPQNYLGFESDAASPSWQTCGLLLAAFDQLDQSLCIGEGRLADNQVALHLMINPKVQELAEVTC